MPLAAALPAGVSSGQTVSSLAHAARTRGCSFGAAVRIDQIEAEPALRDIVLRDCSSLTPEIHMKWDQLEPADGRPSFAAADGLVRFARDHGLAVRGHTLLWEQSTPAWARKRLRAERDWSLVDRHFAAVLGRYADDVAEWDVVNEPIDSERGADGMRRTIFQRTFGSDYIARALRTARAHAPAARLVINDYGFDYDNPVEEDRRRLILRLVEGLKRDGVPLDGIGVQAHLDLAKGPFRPRIVRDFLRDLGQLGVDITITELDVKEHDLSAPLALRDARVAAEARAYLEVALAEPKVRGIVTWGLSDRHSWLSDQQGGPAPVEAEAEAAINRGLPYDAALAAKPMYWAMRDAFLHRG